MTKTSRHIYQLVKRQVWITQPERDKIKENMWENFQKKTKQKSTHVENKRETQNK